MDTKKKKTLDRKTRIRPDILDHMKNSITENQELGELLSTLNKSFASWGKGSITGSTRSFVRKLRKERRS